MVHDDARAFYASLGFATIPLRAREKRPLRKGWREGLAEHWNSAPEDANIGLLTGAPSGGLMVLDFDTVEGPVEILGMTPEQLAVVTMVVRTKRGWHVYAREAGRASSTPRLGLDIRGEGGMVVAPPSVHPDGATYRFVSATSNVIDLAALPFTERNETEATVDVDLASAAEWISLQAPKLQEHWRVLTQPPSRSFDASRSDFAVARCLWEGGRSVDEVAAILMRLPGSRAQERGEAYARQTAARAAAVPDRRRARA